MRWLKLKQLELLYLTARFEQLVMWMVNAVVGRHPTSKRWTREVATSNVVIVVATNVLAEFLVLGLDNERISSLFSGIIVLY